MNGGVWRTRSFHTYNAWSGPDWTATGDQQPCLSVSALSASKSNPNFVAYGCGYPSNQQQRGTDPAGVFVSINGADSWQSTAFPAGYAITSVPVLYEIECVPVCLSHVYVACFVCRSLFVSGSGVAANNDNIILVSSQRGVVLTNVNSTAIDVYGTGVLTGGGLGGIWKSSNLGASFSQVFSGQGIQQVQQSAVTSFIFYALSWNALTPLFLFSSSSGDNWQSSSFPSLTSACPGATAVGNAVLSVSNSGGSQLTVAGFFLAQFDELGNVRANTQCYALYYSSDVGTSLNWQLVPNIPTQGSAFDLGAQGATNFALMAEPGSNTNFYVSGTGRLVLRVSLPSGTWTPISSPLLSTTNAPPSGATQDGSAPHSDARNFWWDATNSDLLLTNDGGVYRRTNPTIPASGKWVSLSGDLAITEAMQVGYDFRTGEGSTARAEKGVEEWRRASCCGMLCCVS